MSMLAVTPFHDGDAAQAARMFDWMADLSGQQDRTIVLAHEEQTNADDVQRAASRAFRTVEHLPVKTCGDSWPMAANCYFGCIAAAMRGRDRWLLLEGDCVTTHPRALEMLETDCERLGKPNVGTVIPAYFQKNGEWVQVGEMLAGVAVYHPNLWDHSPLLRCIQATQQAYARAKSTPKAFDCYLAPEILPFAAVTKLIQHMGRSRNFRRAGDAIVCTYENGSRWDPVVGRDTVLVHGCKDSSLIDLLRSELKVPTGRRTAGPATIVQPKRREAKEFAWSDDSKPKDPPARVAVPVAPPPVVPAAMAKVVDKEAAATLGDARQAIQHWPDCRQALFSLQGARGRYRVVCQCGANSPKLPEGHDWEGVWNATATKSAVMVVENVPTSDPEKVQGMESTRYPMVETSNRLIENDRRVSPSPSNETTAPASNDDIWAQLESAPGPELPKEWCCVTGFPAPVGMPAPALVPVPETLAPVPVIAVTPGERLPTINQVRDTLRALRNQIPTKVVLHREGSDDDCRQILKLRFRKDVLVRFPDWKDLTPRMWQVRLQQAKRRAKATLLKPILKELDRKSGWILTEEARARKMELLKMTKGKQGAFLVLRRHAESIGVEESKWFKRDQLVVLCLEKEFEQPYLDEKVSVPA